MFSAFLRSARNRSTPVQKAITRAHRFTHRLKVGFAGNTCPLSFMKKQTKADFKREWGIDPSHKLRYNGLKGIYWYYFSIWRRISDFRKYDGRCISCPTRLTHWREGDCGHYIAAGHCGFRLLFEPLNCNLQCRRCNNPAWSPDAAAFYGTELDERYGSGTTANLIALYEHAHFKGKTTKEWSQPEYIKRCTQVRKAAERLMNDESIGWHVEIE